jgi:hypothetical protein
MGRRMSVAQIREVLKQEHCVSYAVVVGMAELILERAVHHAEPAHRAFITIPVASGLSCLQLSHE